MLSLLERIKKKRKKKEKRKKRKEFAIKEHVRVEEENRSYVFRELVEKREQPEW